MEANDNPLDYLTLTLDNARPCADRQIADMTCERMGIA